MEARPRCTPPHDRQAEAVPERVLHGRSSFPRMRATVSRATGTPVRRVLNVRTCLLSLFVGVPRRVPAEAVPTNYVTKEEMRRCIASELQSVGVEAQSSEPTAWNTTQSVESMGTLRSSRPLHRQRHLRAWGWASVFGAVGAPWLVIQPDSIIRQMKPLRADYLTLIASSAFLRHSCDHETSVPEPAGHRVR